MKTRGGVGLDEAAMSAPDDTAHRSAVPQKKNECRPTWRPTPERWIARHKLSCFSALLGRLRSSHLQRCFVGLEKSPQRLGAAQQLLPLLVVQRDRIAAQAISAHTALFGDLEVQIAAGRCRQSLLQFCE